MKKTKQDNGNITALVASFIIPGLGQMLKDEIGKGIAILIGYSLSIAAMFVLIGFITTPVLFIWQLIDAYKDTDE